MQLLFLIAAGMIPFFVMLCVPLHFNAGFYFAEEYVVVPCLLFFGSALTQRKTATAKKCLLLSAAAAAWFVIAQLQHHMSHMDTRNFGMFAVSYLLAFPFAAVTEDGGENVGLKWIGRIYLAFSSLMVALTMTLQLDAVPGPFASEIFWDGVRARIFWHPNGSAFVLLLGLGFSLYFLTLAEAKWKKWALGILAVLHFMTMVLTNSRTTILLGCELISGTVFFAIWKGSRKQFLAGAAAAVAVMAVLLGTYNLVFDLHNEVQIEKVMAQQQEGQTTQNLVVDGETGEVSVSGSVTSSQGDLSKDMKTLNGRTHIWKAAFGAFRDNPQIRIWGTDYVAEEVSYRNYFPVVNCHNAWIQMLILLGAPGLLVAVAYTVIAVWNLLVTMFRKQEDLSRKVVAMMVVCLLAGSMLEVYLFTGEDLSNSQNFLFFLCTGYLVQWNRKETT